LDSTSRSDPRYRLVVAAPRAGLVRSESGLGLVADISLSSLGRRRAIDTLMVCGGSGVHDLRANDGAMRSIREIAAKARRTTSVCSGAFALAHAGLLDGRRVATHWARADRLQREFPAVLVDAAPVFIRDGDVWTSAGVTAGIDLALALVEDDLDADVARLIAKWLVMFLRRPGGQQQFAVPLSARHPQRDPILDVCAYVSAEPGKDLSVAALAAIAHMSVRHFVRVFHQEMGRTPGHFVLEVRIEAARRALETGQAGVVEIAQRCGFGTSETMRRSFLRVLGVAPSAYRGRFHQRRVADISVTPAHGRRTP
jgi:transcriptional regulator GlxA family with amidase domain